jgi:tetratricopeptide (TPR) repeat protein
MVIRISFPRFTSFILVFGGMFFQLSIATNIFGQTAHSVHSTVSSMQQHYDAAQRFQSSGDTDKAESEYKLFLADALSHIANGRSHIAEFTRAAPLFDEALKFTPDDAALRLDYAQAALTARDLPRAKLLSQGTLDSSPDKLKGRLNAKAHLILGRALLGMNENEQAVEQFAAAVAIDSNFENGYALAVAHLALSDKTSSATIFKEMLAGFGDTAAIHMQFGRAYGEADFPEEAIMEFKKALAEDNRLPGAHYSLGASYLLRSGTVDFAQAETEFRKELAIHPNDYFSYSQLGYIAMSQHKLQEAKSDLTRAAKLDPQNPDNFLLLGQIDVDLGGTSDAEAALRKAIEVTADPSRNHYQIRGAHYQLGRLLVEDGNTVEGKKEMAISQELLLQNKLQDVANVTGQPLVKSPFPKAALARPADSKASAALQEFENRVGPAIADSYNNLGVIRAVKEDYAEAAGYFEQAAKWNPTMEGLDYNWGRAAFSAHLYAQAVGPLDRYLQAHQKEVGARSTLGLAQYMAHDYAAALQTLQPIEANVDDVPSLNYAYADSMVKTGDLQPGIERLKALALANPNSVTLHQALGAGYLASGNNKQAAEEFRAALGIDPANTESKHELALSLIALGQINEAEQLLSELAVAGSKDADVYYQLGRLLLEQGELKASVSDLEIAAKLEPASVILHHELADAYRRNMQLEDADRETKLYQDLQTQHSSPNQTMEPK